RKGQKREWATPHRLLWAVARARERHETNSKLGSTLSGKGEILKSVARKVDPMVYAFVKRTAKDSARFVWRNVCFGGRSLTVRVQIPFDRCRRSWQRSR